MAETREEFTALVKRLEGESKREPGAYRFWLGALAVIGYAYILFMLLLLLGLLAGMVLFAVNTGRVYVGEIKIFFFLLVVIYVILRSLWVTVPPPEGIALQRAEAPQLFELIDSISRALKTPRLDHVLLTGDFNAAVAQLPRLGLFGVYKNYLILGYPLLQAVSPEQFRAILTHEMGHLSEQHGRFGIWIWRLRETWGRLVAGLSGHDGKGGFLFNWFLRWYGPYFMAYSFVLARADEYAADRYSGQLAGAQNFAESLAAIRLRDTYLDKAFWPALSKLMQEHPMPPHDPFTRMAATLKQPLPADDARKWLGMALAQQTDYDDTHPALRDRLAALGFPDAAKTPERFIPAPVTTSAAEHYLGIGLPGLTEKLNTGWVKSITPTWEKEYQEAQDGKARLQVLETKLADAPLTQDEAWERATLVAHLRENAEAIPLLRALLAIWPEYAPAKLMLGKLLLDEEDESGLGLIQEAMGKNSEFELVGCQLIYGYLKLRGRDGEAEPFLQRGIKRHEQEQQADTEASHVTGRDRFVSPEMPADAVAHLVSVLREIPEVKTAYLVRKILPAMPQRVCHVLAIKPKFKALLLDEDDAVQKLVTRITEHLQLDHETLIIVLYKNTLFAEKMVKQVEGSVIYQKAE